MEQTKHETCALCKKSDERVTMAMLNNGALVWFHERPCAEEYALYLQPKLQER